MSYYVHGAIYSRKSQIFPDFDLISIKISNMFGILWLKSIFAFFARKTSLTADLGYEPLN